MLNKPAIRVLKVDLSSQRITVQEREDLFEWIGGTGVATKLLSELMRPDLDTLAPEQPIIFAIGPMTTIFPVVTKTVATFLSPMTGEFGESHAGARLAYSLRSAGYDALVISGRARRPVFLAIQDNRVEIRDAGIIWGLDVVESGRLLRQLTPAPGHRSILRIGPAGENLVRYAGVNVETYRHFGRLGLGAVFGSKNLKAVVTIGAGHQCIGAQRKEYRKLYEQIYEKVHKTDVMEKYHELGTPKNVLPLNELGGLPTRNLQANRFESAADISGEAFAQHDLMYKRACTGCPIGCIHIALLRQPFGNPEEQEYQSSYVGYDYELLYSLGSMLCLSDRRDVLQLIEDVDRLGLDAISAGVTLAWATEAADRGLIDPGELGARPAFGQVEGYRAALEAISAGKTELARRLGLGSAAAAAHYGGADFAISLGGQEIAGYHTGYANMLGHIIGARHSHLDNAGYALDQKKADLSDEGIIDALMKEEAKRNMFTSLVICLFATGVYDVETIRSALSVLGIERSASDLEQLGWRIYDEKLAIKRRLGAEPTRLPVPQRFFETPSLRGPLLRERVERMLAIYRQRVDARLDAPAGQAVA